MAGRRGRESGVVVVVVCDALFSFSRLCLQVRSARRFEVAPSGVGFLTPTPPSLSCSPAPPGNLLAARDGSLVYLDFGMVSVFACVLCVVLRVVCLRVFFRGRGSPKKCTQHLHNAPQQPLPITKHKHTLHCINTA